MSSNVLIKENVICMAVAIFLLRGVNDLVNDSARHLSQGAKAIWHLVSTEEKKTPRHFEMSTTVSHKSLQMMYRQVSNIRRTKSNT